MQHDVNIQVVDTTTGTPPEADGVMGLFIQAIAIASTFNLNTAYLLTGLEDLAALGIDANYDATNGVSVYQQVTEFYAQAGDGALLWLIGVAKNTAFATFVASDTFDQLIRFTAQADPLNRVKIIGLAYAPPTTLNTTTDFPADVTAAITALQTKIVNLVQAGYPFSGIVDGYNMKSTATATTLGSQATNTAYGVSLCITGNTPNGVSGVGFALGRFARISVGHGFGAVEDGSLNTTAAYLTNSLLATTASTLVVGHVYTVFGGTVTYNGTTYPTGAQFTAVSGHTTFTTADTGYLADNVTPIGNIPGTSGNPINGLSPTDIKQLGQKQFMFMRTWEGVSGFYWNDAATCISSAKSLSSQEYNRVANRLVADALGYFTQFVGKNLPIDKATGNVSAGWLANLQADFYESFIGPLNDTSGTGDLSDAALIIDGTNFSATRRLKFTLNIVASLIMGGVDGVVKFVKTL